MAYRLFQMWFKAVIINHINNFATPPNIKAPVQTEASVSTWGAREWANDSRVSLSIFFPGTPPARHDYTVKGRAVLKRDIRDDLHPACDGDRPLTRGFPWETGRRR